MSSTPRLLLVDDDRAVLESYRRALGEYTLSSAGDGMIARKILSETTVDVVVCDLEMPGIGGLELMRWAAEHCPGPVWIVVSGKATIDAATQALKLGAFDFICKPLHSAIQLQTVVANAARHRANVADIAERRAVEAALRKSVEMRDEFISIAAHELRTPLAALQLQLQGTMHLVERLNGPGTAKFLGKLQIANRQADVLSRLVGGLLDVARAGQLSLDPQDVDLVVIARDVIERYAPQAHGAGCAITFDGDPVVIGRWDRARMDQVVTNLLTNAIKYGAGHPIDVRVTSAEGCARLVVEDHGIGILADDLGRVFARFERGVSSKHYGGLGLGLYITRQIVEAHGGTVEVASEVHRGATFTVSVRQRPLSSYENHPAADGASA